MTRDEQISHLTAQLTKAENRIEDLLEVKDQLCISLERALKNNLTVTKSEAEKLPDGFVALTTKNLVENELIMEKVFVNVDYISRISVIPPFASHEFDMCTRIDSVGKQDISVKETFDEVLTKVKAAQINIFK